MLWFKFWFRFTMSSERSVESTIGSWLQPFKKYRLSWKQFLPSSKCKCQTYSSNLLNNHWAPKIREFTSPWISGQLSWLIYCMHLPLKPGSKLKFRSRRTGCRGYLIYYIKRVKYWLLTWCTYWSAWVTWNNIIRKSVRLSVSSATKCRCLLNITHKNQHHRMKTMRLTNELF